MFDDCNKILLAGLGSGQYPNADAALRAYAQRYFGATDDRAADWSQWLAQWGNRTKAPLPGAADALARLADGAKPAWRLEQWRSKVELETLDRAIGLPKQWTSENLALAEQFFAAQERLYRDVYRLGPVRHVLNPRFMPPAWYDSWSKAHQQTAKPAPLLPQQ